MVPAPLTTVFDTIHLRNLITEILIRVIENMEGKRQSDEKSVI